VYQSSFSTLAQNLMGFLAGDFVPQTIFNGVSPETAKMKANLNTTC